MQHNHHKTYIYNSETTAKMAQNCKSEFSTTTVWKSWPIFQQLNIQNYP